MNSNFQHYTELNNLSNQFNELISDLIFHMNFLASFLDDETSLITNDETVLLILHKKAEESFKVEERLKQLKKSFSQMATEAQNRCLR